MLDLTSAVILGAVLLGLISLVYTLVTGTAQQRVTVAICLAVSIVVVLLVGASDFAHEQVVLNRPLDSLSVISQLLVAILLAGIASAMWETLRAAKNIGANQ